MQMSNRLFTGNPIYIYNMLLLFVILHDDYGDKEGRIGALTARVGALDTTLRNGMMSENSAHLCANGRLSKRGSHVDH